MPTNDAAALEPCPNPECGGGDIDVRYLGMDYQAFCWDCRTTGPAVAHVDPPVPKSMLIDEAVAYLDACHAKSAAEARRLWNLLPRAPRWTSEPPPEAVDEPIFYLCEHTDRGVRFVYPSRQMPGEPRMKPHPAFRFCVIPQPPSAERSDRP